MATFSFAEGGAMFDSTPIENLFLLEHLPTAPDAFLRVYLYARVLALHPELGGDFAQMARALRLSEDTVYDAFAYWEQQGLVRRLTDRPPTYEIIPLRMENLAAVNPMERDYYAYRDFNASLQVLFKNRAIESHEYGLANDWLNLYGYEQDAVLRMVQYGLENTRGKNGAEPTPRSVFKKTNDWAKEWADRGCRTLEDVERFIAEREDVYSAAQAVLKRFSINKQPSQDELNLARKWVKEWGLSQEAILDACSETTKTTKPSFAYLDSILKNRHEGQDGPWRELSDILKELDPKQAQPSPEQQDRYAKLRKAGFETETIKLAAIQCHSRKKTRFDDVEWMLGRWGEQGIFTHDAAEAYVKELERKSAPVRALLEACGLERRPTNKDMDLYESWQATHDAAVIDYAATCARGMDKPMLFMDKLLKDWAEAGVRTVAEAEARREAARASRAAARAANGTAPANPALNYEQREYKEEDFGDDFYVDLDKYVEGGDPT